MHFVIHRFPETRGSILITLRDSVERLKELAAEHGRDPAAFEIAPQYAVYVGTTHEEAVAKYRQSQMCKHFDSLSASTLKGQGGMDHCGINLIGDAAGVIAKAEALKAAGATHLMGLYFAVNTVPELLEQMQVFAEEVIPGVG